MFFFNISSRIHHSSKYLKHLLDLQYSNIEKYVLFSSGSQKCGTTSLSLFFENSGYLCQGKTKEHHFFDKDNEYKKGGTYYAATFAKCSSDIITIDATPNYMSGDASTNAKRIYDSYSDADLKKKKFIILLRDPAYREFSWYSHMIRECTKIMHEYIRVNGQKTPSNGWDTKAMCKGNGWECGSVNCNDGGKYAKFGEEAKSLSTFAQYFDSGNLMKSNSLYIEQIKSFEKYFSRSQMFIVNFQTLFIDAPTDTMRSIARFLNLPVSAFGNHVSLPHTNAAGVHTYYDCRVAKQLQAYYAPYNAKLYEYMRHTRMNAPPSEPNFPEFELHRCGY